MPRNKAKPESELGPLELLIGTHGYKRAKARELGEKIELVSDAVRSASNLLYFRDRMEQYEFTGNIDRGIGDILSICGRELDGCRDLAKMVTTPPTVVAPGAKVSQRAARRTR
jgi:hypothetical protein